MRIVGGERRGMVLRAPTGTATRPTSDRARQALFDMLLHAPWGGRSLIEGAAVLDAFAGTGALGLEALSRGAAHASFMERHGAARAIIGLNLAAARFSEQARVMSCDVLRPLRTAAPMQLVFLDPPYGEGFVPRAIVALRRAGWIGPETVIVAETGADEPPLDVETPLACRRFGAATVTIWHAG